LRAVSPLRQFGQVVRLDISAMDSSSASALVVAVVAKRALVPASSFRLEPSHVGAFHQPQYRPASGSV